MLRQKITFLQDRIIYKFNNIRESFDPYKTVRIMNKDHDEILSNVNMFHRFRNIDFIKKKLKNHDINSPTLVEFKNDKRNIVTIIKPTNISDLVDKIDKMSINDNNQYERIKIDSPPTIIIKKISYGDIDFSKILKTIVHPNGVITIEDFLYFFGNNAEHKNIQIVFFSNFTEHTVEYDYDKVKCCDITKIINFCVADN